LTFKNSSVVNAMKKRRQAVPGARTGKSEAVLAKLRSGPRFDVDGRVYGSKTATFAGRCDCGDAVALLHCTKLMSTHSPTARAQYTLPAFTAREHGPSSTRIVCIWTFCEKAEHAGHTFIHGN